MLLIKVSVVRYHRYVIMWGIHLAVACPRTLSDASNMIRGLLDPYRNGSRGGEISQSDRMVQGA